MKKTTLIFAIVLSINNFFSANPLGVCSDYSNLFINNQLFYDSVKTYNYKIEIGINKYELNASVSIEDNILLYGYFSFFIFPDLNSSVGNCPVKYCTIRCDKDYIEFEKEEINSSFMTSSIYLSQNKITKLVESIISSSTIEISIFYQHCKIIDKEGFIQADFINEFVSKKDIKDLKEFCNKLIIKK